MGDPVADADGCAGSWPTAGLVGSGAIAELDEGGSAADCVSDCFGGVVEVGAAVTVVYSVWVTKITLSEGVGMVGTSGVWMFGGTPGPAAPVEPVVEVVVAEEIVEF